MIKLTRLNGQEIVVNALLIEKIEATPDTMLTLTTGSRVLVREEPDFITALASDYLRRLQQTGGLRASASGRWAQRLRDRSR